MNEELAREFIRNTELVEINENTIVMKDADGKTFVVADPIVGVENQWFWHDSDKDFKLSKEKIIMEAKNGLWIYNTHAMSHLTTWLPYFAHKKLYPIPLEKILLYFDFVLLEK
jgi:hypothetical protein